MSTKLIGQCWLPAYLRALSYSQPKDHPFATPIAAHQPDACFMADGASEKGDTWRGYSEMGTAL